MLVHFPQNLSLLMKRMANVSQLRVNALSALRISILIPRILFGAMPLVVTISTSHALINGLQVGEAME